MNPFSTAGREVPVEVVRSPRARRLTLRADAVRGVVRVSLPPGAAVPDAERFVAAHHGWIAARVAHWPLPLPFEPGAEIPFDGGVLTLDWRPGRASRVRRDGDRLLLGGECDAVAGRTRRWMRATALGELKAMTAAVAERVARRAHVAVRDPATRWGSCTPGGSISYSWRLILAPPAVRQSVVAHEVAHLIHPNHGRDFWVLAERLTDGDLAVARAWLKANGAALHWVGRPT